MTQSIIITMMPHKLVFWDAICESWNVRNSRVHMVIIFPHQSVQHHVNMFCKFFVCGGDDYVVWMISSGGNYIYLVAVLSLTILILSPCCIFWSMKIETPDYNRVIIETPNLHNVCNNLWRSIAYEFRGLLSKLVCVSTGILHISMTLVLWFLYCSTIVMLCSIILVMSLTLFSMVVLKTKVHLKSLSILWTASLGYIENS